MNKVLLIIPAYNEEKNVERVVEEIRLNHPELDYVVINDGSKDDTAKICRRNGYNLVDLPVNCGLPGAFQTGMRYAHYMGYEYAIQYDGDGQHNPEYIKGMFEFAENNNLDVVIGSRYINEKKPVTARMIGSNLISGCIFLTTGKLIKDPTSGMRLYNRTKIKKLTKTLN